MGCNGSAASLALTGIGLFLACEHLAYQACWGARLGLRLCFMRHTFGPPCLGTIVRRDYAHHHERNEPLLHKMPRLKMDFNRRSFGRLRALIDWINDHVPVGERANISSITK